MPKIFAIHPGDILLTEFMEPLGLTAYRLAKELLVPLPRINDVVRGKRSISADTAIRWAGTSIFPRNSGSTCRTTLTCAWPKALKR